MEESVEQARAGSTGVQDAQLEVILRRYGNRVSRGPEDWSKTGTEYLYETDAILAREEYLDEVRAVIDDWSQRTGERRPGPADRGEPERGEPERGDRDGGRHPGGDRPAGAVDRPCRGLALLRLPAGTDALGLLDYVDLQLGEGVASPNHLVSISPTAGNCPATEPEPVLAHTPPWPPVASEARAGAGVKVVVADTGLDAATAATTPWLAGVTGEPDDHIQGANLLEYAGHGTFIAGVVRCVAPGTEVHVRNTFPLAGANFESEMIRGLERIVREDDPDIINLSAGTWSRRSHDLLALQIFNKYRLSQHKGVALVTAAGNNASRRPFWPGAAPYAVAVGALSEHWPTVRSRAYFTDFGGWVDVYTPGEGLVNAYPTGLYTYVEPPHVPGTQQHFNGLARWSGTSFSAPLMCGLIAVRMSRTGENGRTAAAALIAEGQAQAVAGVGAVLLP
jgi:hypothetical protein